MMKLKWSKKWSTRFLHHQRTDKSSFRYILQLGSFVFYLQIIFIYFNKSRTWLKWRKSRMKRFLTPSRSRTVLRLAFETKNFALDYHNCSIPSLLVCVRTRHIVYRHRFSSLFALVDYIYFFLLLFFTNTVIQ